MDMSYLEITPMEIDPLAEVGSEAYPSYLTSQLGDWIFKMYSKVEKTYTNKLFQKFEPRTVDILLEELENNNQTKLTIGHLASYINMRTGQEFRNRSLVKLLRRMNICSQQLEKDNFRRVFCRKQLPEIKEWSVRILTNDIFWFIVRAKDFSDKLLMLESQLLQILRE